MEATRIALSPDELATFVQKLEGFTSTLPPQEQAFLQQMIADASDAANEDPSGYANVAGALHRREDEVAGYSMDPAEGGSVRGSVVGYADGLAREETLFGDQAFVAGQSQE